MKSSRPYSLLPAPAPPAEARSCTPSLSAALENFPTANPPGKLRVREAARQGRDKRNRKVVKSHKTFASIYKNNTKTRTFTEKEDQTKSSLNILSPKLI